MQFLSVTYPANDIACHVETADTNCTIGSVQIAKKKGQEREKEKEKKNLKRTWNGLHYVASGWELWPKSVLYSDIIIALLLWLLEVLNSLKNQLICTKKGEKKEREKRKLTPWVWNILYVRTAIVECLLNMKLGAWAVLQFKRPLIVLLENKKTTTALLLYPE